MSRMRATVCAGCFAGFLGREEVATGEHVPQIIAEGSRFVRDGNEDVACGDGSHCFTRELYLALVLAQA